MTSLDTASAVRVLWTGGLDSTYRIVELSRMDVTIQPVYCANPERDSTAMEKYTIERILAALSAEAAPYAEQLKFKEKKVYNHLNFFCLYLKI